MAEPTRAEILLEQVTKGNGLIRRLETVKNHPIAPVPVKLSPPTKAKMRAFQDDLQRRIDQLADQRDKGSRLVEQIPDGEARLVLQLRYGLLGNATKKTPWLDMPELVHYELSTIYRRHREGLDYLNKLLEKDDENRC